MHCFKGEVLCCYLNFSFTFHILIHMTRAAQTIEGGCMLITCVVRFKILARIHIVFYPSRNCKFFSYPARVTMLELCLAYHSFELGIGV